MAQAYGKAPSAETPAQTEAWALSTMARRLADAKEKPEDVDGMLAVVRLNWRLWTILQAELVAPDHPMPVELRSNLLNLSNFIDKHTVGLLAEPKPEKLDVLININRQIAGGLYDSVSQQAKAPAAEPPPPQSA
ncbi:MAG TPA: flagellar biosynthesis regulator FlaF [Alphaproteobacteria bacterium]|nr:flagellar biosynthesis regulator FlaF [Alphaproteobacteria bacterium]